jgi:hypothetical protein
MVETENHHRLSKRDLNDNRSILHISYSVAPTSLALTLLHHLLLHHFLTLLLFLLLVAAANTKSVVLQILLLLLLLLGLCSSWQEDGIIMLQFLIYGIYIYIYIYTHIYILTHTHKHTHIHTHIHTYTHTHIIMRQLAGGRHNAGVPHRLEPATAGVAEKGTW